MPSSITHLRPAEASRTLGVSIKALRLYERKGLIAPGRDAAGWRVYGPDDMARAQAIAALRKLDLSLGQIAGILAGGEGMMDSVLAQQQAHLAERIRQLSEAARKARRPRRHASPVVAFDLPWPWGGERFELAAPPSITFLTGPLGSGKLRLAVKLAENLPGARFIGMERAADALCALEEDGAALVVDMVEQGLDLAGQKALIANLRRRGSAARPLILITRSNAILDLGALQPDEAVIYCPANHSPPFIIEPYPGGAGYEAAATCLASPEVRARTEGVIALRPDAA